MNARLIAYYDPRYITGRFGDPRPGRTHQGTDFSHSRTPGITPVPALLDGTVVKVWKNDATHGYGNRVDTLTARGEVSYSHLNAPSPFRKGDRMGQGDVIGHEGVTGFVAGSCCHIEHAVSGVKVDPLPLIRDVLATLSGAGNEPAGSLTPSKEDDMYDDNKHREVLTAARPIRLYKMGTGIVAVGAGGGFWVLPTYAYVDLLIAWELAGPNIAQRPIDLNELDSMRKLLATVNPVGDGAAGARVDAVLSLSDEDVQRLVDAMPTTTAADVVDELADRLSPKAR